MKVHTIASRISGKVVGGGVLGLAALVGVGALAFPGNADTTGQDPALTKREETSTELVTVDDDEGPEDDDTDLGAASQVTRSQASRAGAVSRQTRASAPTRASRASAPSRQTRASAPSRQTRASAASRQTRASAPSRVSAPSRASAPSRDTVSRDTASRG